MAPYKPQTTEKQREAARTYAHCAAMVGDGTVEQEVAVCGLYLDLTHCEACLREALEEIERLKTGRCDDGCKIEKAVAEFYTPKQELTNNASH